MVKKRRIPKNPGKSRCRFSYEIEGETVIMSLYCAQYCLKNPISLDICWSNLVRAISGGAIPGKIIFHRNQLIICEHIFLSLLINAALLLRRIERKIEELSNQDLFNDTSQNHDLINLRKAILYDIPQLIDRNIDSSRFNSNFKDCFENRIGHDSLLCKEILEQKRKLQLIMEEKFIA